MKVSVLATTLAILLVGGFSLSAQAGPAGDADADGTFDTVDLCDRVLNGATTAAMAPVPNGCDTDIDGYGNQCDCDFNNDGSCGLPDFGIFGPQFGSTGAKGFSSADMNCDGAVGLPDFGLFAPRFGRTTGPSGYSCAGEIPCR